MTEIRLGLFERFTRHIIENATCHELNCPVGGTPPFAFGRKKTCRTKDIAESLGISIAKLVRKDPRNDPEFNRLVHEKHCLPLVQKYEPRAHIDPSGTIKKF